MMSIPAWMVDGIETSRRVWVIIQFKPQQQHAISPEDDRFMEWIHKD
jgi:hypothetical protein